MPILPSNKKNPLNNRKELLRVKKDLKSRYARITRDVKEVFSRISYIERDQITRQIVNQKVPTKSVYDYDLDPVLLNTLNQSIDEIIDKWLLEGAPSGFWYNNYIDIQYQQGTANAWANLSSISTSYNASRPTLENILFSAPYQRRIGLVHAARLEKWKGMADSDKSMVREILRGGMAAGQNPRKVASTLSKRLKTSLSYASKVARTEMGQAQREARRQESENAAQTLGVYTRMLHLSALKPNSRATHIDRHGEVHTREQDREWYTESNFRNSWNCQCTQLEVLTDENGNVLESMQKTVNRALAQKKKFRAFLQSEGIVLK